jgi:hypothetical protein
MGDFLIVSALITSIVCSIAGFFTLDRAKRGVTGALLGLFLGPIGVATAWGLRLKALRGAEEDWERPIDELERLAALKERGHVTEEEFNARKRVLLGGAAAPPQPSQLR